MSSGVTRAAMLAVGIVLVFATVAAVLLHIIPAPHRPSDYLVVGAVATLAAMAAAFVALITGWVKSPGTFFIRRRKQ